MAAKYTKKTLVCGVAAASLTLCFGLFGCKSNSAAAPIVNGNGQTAETGGDPALANVAQPYNGGTAGGYGANNGNGGGGTTKVLGQSESYQPQANGETYGYDQQAPAPIVQGVPEGSPPPAGGYGYADTEAAGEQAIAETDQAPPPLPEYDQPPAPDPNYLWTPGYWNYAQTGYYWVPGLWVAPPYYGALWTPPYWGSYGNGFLFHRGYWGPHVGFYGGINYGFGYIGFGYFGGYWRGHDFLYNRAVTNVNTNVVHNFYSHEVVYNGHTFGPHPTDRVSFNGGRGGIDVQPRPSELAAMHEAHYAPEAAQRDARLAAASNRGQFFRADGGHPAMAFAARPMGSASNIAVAPHEQAFNRTSGEGGLAAAAHGAPGGALGAHGAPGAPNGSSEANRANGAGRTPEARPGAAPMRGAPTAPNSAVGRPAPAPYRSQAPQGNETAHQPAFGGNRAAPAVARPQGTPGQLNNTERPSAPIERREAPPQAAPATRPEATRPQAAARPAPAPREAPVPHAATAAHGGGGEEHGGHH